MSPLHANTTNLPARTAFLRQAERHDLAAGVGLAKLAMWYASEGVPFDPSVTALAQRAGGDSTVIRVAYECLAFSRLSHSTHSQVMALFAINELRRRVDLASGPKRGVASRLTDRFSRLARGGAAFRT